MRSDVKKTFARRAMLGATVATVAGLAMATPTFAAEEGPTAADVQKILDNVWILVAAILVIFMQAGFALVEAGLTRGLLGRTVGAQGPL